MCLCVQPVGAAAPYILSIRSIRTGHQLVHAYTASNPQGSLLRLEGYVVHRHPRYAVSLGRGSLERPE